MSSDFKTSFITYYVRSLGERTRQEKKGTKFGFDWIIYNLALSENWIPHRLPFIRTGPDETSKTKTEAEFGIDLAFLSSDKKTLRIFVLKDEVLKNKTWGNQSFDIDIRNASAPDLTGRELSKVTDVEVVLAYNKDEDHTGIELYDRLTRALGTKVGDNAKLSFERWNLTTIVEKVESTLLTPTLLPQKFFSHFSYICAQFDEFEHGSDAWKNQLVPNWRRFLDELFSEFADERCVRLLPVALLLLYEHGNENRTKETGWIDLMEWGMLAAWRVLQTTRKKKPIEKAVWKIWVEFYLAELERYYGVHNDDLAVGLSLDKPYTGSYVDSIASAVVAHWHVARLGILGISYAECLPDKTKDDKEKREFALGTVSNWLVQLFNANPSAMRPLLDLHHAELFLAWGTLLHVHRFEDLKNCLYMLSNRLFVRRFGNAHIPFIDGRNSLDTVFEYAATQQKPDEFCETSSLYLLCLMELVCILKQEDRDTLLWQIYNRLVLGRADDGQQMPDSSPIDLMMWYPPEDWGEKVLVNSLANEGECATIMFGEYGQFEPTCGADIAEELEKLVEETRKKRKSNRPEYLSMSVAILGCIKHRSPIPPEMWRRGSFGPPASEAKPVAKKRAKKKK